MMMLFLIVATFFQFLAAGAVTSESVAELLTILPKEGHACAGNGPMILQGLRQPESHGQKRGVQAARVLQRADVRLEKFFYRLRSFVTESEFSVDEFQQKEDKLYRQLAGIFRVLEKQPLCPEMEAKLRFTQYMFRVMVETAEHLSEHDYMGISGEHLLYCVTELSVRLLVLFDSRGNPDIYIGGFEVELAKFTELLQVWKEKFRSLSKSSFSLKVLFRMQVSRAERTMRVLASHIPMKSEG